MIILTEQEREHLLMQAEDITFMNILHMRRPELLRILGGEKAIHVIPQSNQRRKLNRDGVLTTTYGRGGKTILLTSRARKALEEET